MLGNGLSDGWVVIVVCITFNGIATMHLTNITSLYAFVRVCVRAYVCVRAHVHE